MTGQCRVAMMCESDALGGAEMVVLRLAQALHSRGHTVVGIGPDEATQPNRGSNGWLRGQFGQNGFAWRTYRKRHPIDPALAPQLARLMAELDVQVAHSHEFGMAVYGTAAARRAGVRHIISMHGNMAMTNRWTRRVALRWAFAKSRATVAVSEQTREHLEKALGLGAGRLMVIRNGVPERRGDRVLGRRAVGAQEHDTVVLAVGSLIQRKGHGLLIRALQELRTERPDVRWRLAIAGTGELRSQLEALVTGHGLEDRVVLLGPRDDVPDLLAGADVFAMPSLWEGLPLAILEAMFAGCAVVASDVSGIPEAIVHGEHGLLVQPGEVPALREALGRLLTDRPLRAALGEAARQRARREFSIEAMANAYERLYRADD